MENYAILKFSSDQVNCTLGILIAIATFLLFLIQDNYNRINESSDVLMKIKTTPTFGIISCVLVGGLDFYVYYIWRYIRGLI